MQPLRTLALSGFFDLAGVPDNIVSDSALLHAGIGIGTARGESVEDRNEPKTAGQWIRQVIVALIALFLVWWMLRVYIL